MEPITEQQEWTLRNWVTTFGRHPGPLEKAFLRTEKGLTEEQIDSWLEKVGNFQYVETPATKQQQISHDGFLSNFSPATRENLSFLEHLDFGAMNDDLLNLIPAYPQETHHWSSIEQLQSEYNSAVSEHSQAWPSSGNYRGGLHLSAIPPLPESKALLPESFNSHWTYTSDSDRSSRISYGSSRTWDSASTVASFTELYGEDQQNDSSSKDFSFAQSRYSRASSHHTSSFACNTIPEDSISDHAHVHKPQPTPSSSSSRNLTPKPLKVSIPKSSSSDKVPGKYSCTACTCTFTRKWEWKRHEEAQHDPQTYWTCMLSDPAVATSSGWLCAFCDTVETTREDIAVHLVKEHKINQCSNKMMANKTWTREDKLKQHLQQVHSLKEESTRWKSWQRPATRKSAWGCGFCGACSFTWEGRLNHVAEHFEEESLFGARWSMSLVIKGLLKQCQPDFNLAKAWKDAIKTAPNGDRLLAWSNKDAAMLKVKLEFHQGTPKELARMALKLAVTSHRDALQVWTDASQPATSSERTKATKVRHNAPRSQSLMKQDIEMVDEMSNYI